MCLPLVGSQLYELYDQEKPLDTGRPSHGSGASSAHSDRHHFRNRLVDRDAIRTPVLVEFCLVG